MSTKIRIQIQKTIELPDAKHPGNIPIGYMRSILMDSSLFKPPTIGERFPCNHFWNTSIVTEILSPNSFKTLNSVYTWEIIKNE